MLNISVNSVIVIYKFELDPYTVYLHAVIAVSHNAPVNIDPRTPSLGT